MNTNISERRRKIHVITEALSVLTVAPFGIYVATRKELPFWARVAGGALTASILIIDGSLLAT